MTTKEKYNLVPGAAFTLLFLILLLQSCTSQDVLSVDMDFNFDWEFKLTDTVNPSNSKNWHHINLPHDWSIKNGYDSINGEGATGYFLGGLGEYRKKFKLSIKKESTAYLLFDGIYNNATTILNGQELGFHPYGYSPFYFDITKQLRSNEVENLLEVRIDRSRYADSRWYTGSGIYRNVKLITKNNLHVPIWGTFITTPKVSATEALSHFDVTVKNNYQKEQSFTLKIEIFDDSGLLVGQTLVNSVVPGQQEQQLSSEVILENPKLWDVNTPYLYSAKISLIQNETELDTNKIMFGVRSIRFDAQKGFFLNGENVKIKGVCLHHDAGLVGAAVPKDVWRRRLKKLKQVGANAIRIAHNPASQEFLDLCDEMGFLVQDEFFDEWDNPKDKRFNMNEQSVDYVTRGYGEHFQEWAEKDLKNTVLAHRNHPSIIQWSIGNEIEWTYPANAAATGFFNNINWSGNYFWSVPPNSPKEIRDNLNNSPKEAYDIGTTAKKLAAWTKELDTTRYVIANAILPSASYESGLVDALDMVGYSYRRVMYDYGHENYPEKPIMGTENLVQWHEWKAVQERSFVAGTFLWTGIDYLGEARSNWPIKGTPSGMLDFSGFEKPSYHMMKTLWNDEPHLYLTSQILNNSIYKLDANGNPIERKEGAWETALWEWHNVNEHWNYSNGEATIVEAYSNCDEVELFLNNKSLGRKKLVDFNDHIYKWAVPYAPGKLSAQGYIDGKKVDFDATINTASAPSMLAISSDKKKLESNGYDVAHITVQLLDENGNPVKHLEKEISFSFAGNVKVLGVDNGSLTNVQSHNANTVTTNQGKCLLIVQATKKPSNLTITASGTELKSNTIEIQIKEPNKINQ